MAGFFGLFDYNKVGPGIDKNAPQKRSFVVFFEIFFRKFWKLTEASLLYVLLSLPVLTNGLANAGLTFIGRNFARQKHAFVAGDFFDTIKKNWRQALPVGIINLVLQLIMGYALFFYYPRGIEEEAAPMISYVLFSVIVLVNLIFIFMQYYLYMLMITFKFHLRQLYRNSFIFAISGLKANLIIALSMLLIYVVLFLIAMLGELGLALALLAAITVVPGFRNLLIQYNVFPLVKKYIIDPYYAEHPQDDVKQRQDLALEPAGAEKKPDDAEDDEVIFKDMGRTVTVDETKEEPSARQIPRQYSEEQMRRGRRLTRDAADDDDTI